MKTTDREITPIGLVPILLAILALAACFYGAGIVTWAAMELQKILN